MDFDPLSLYTPSPPVEELEQQIDSIESTYTIVTTTETPISFQEQQQQPIIEDDSHLQPIHSLDLPNLNLKPPYEVLITILKLLAPNELLNFGNDLEIINFDPEIIFNEKEIFEINESTLSWFKLNCPRFDNLIKLANIPNLSSSLKLNHTSEYNSYITNLIINPLSWILKSQQIEEIHKLASLRISENCGRTAQPEIIRKIKLNNLKIEYLKLREPSLTNDNLGLKTWGSSLILSQRLLNNSDDDDDDDKNKKKRKEYLYGKILELGSGTGLVGMISSILGFESYLTDLPEIIPNLKSNVELNGLNLIVHELDWTNPNSFIDVFDDIKFQTILLSDPIYSSKHPYWVVNMINKFLDLNDINSRVLIQIPLRPKFENERQLLWDLLNNNNYQVLQHEIEDGFDDFGEMKFCFKMYKYYNNNNNNNNKD